MHAEVPRRAQAVQGLSEKRFSPHAIGAFPTTWEIARPRWLAYDCAVIDHCTHVLLLPRWETSTGARAERDYALTIGKPVITSLDELEAT